MKIQAGAVQDTQLLRWKLLRLRGAPQLRELYGAELQGVVLKAEPGTVRRLEELKPLQNEEPEGGHASGHASEVREGSELGGVEMEERNSET